MLRTGNKSQNNQSLLRTGNRKSQKISLCCEPVTENHKTISQCYVMVTEITKIH